MITIPLVGTVRSHPMPESPNDANPLAFLGAHPANWTPGALPTNFRELHLEQSPNTPYSIVEFQGGAIDTW